MNSVTAILPMISSFSKLTSSSATNGTRRNRHRPPKTAFAPAPASRFAAVEAHRSYERFEQGHQLVSADGDDVGPHYGRNAALVVAVMAAFLAVATFLSNEAVKHVITGETHRSEATAQLETNRIRIDVAAGNSTMLRVLGAGGPSERRAAREAEAHEERIVKHLEPADARLTAEIHDHAHETDHANTQHVDYELAEVGLQVGIVLASVSIIARRRWLLGAAGAAASAGVLLLLIGLLLV
jgi:rRNA maturation endonuclease Nob1